MGVLTLEDILEEIVGDIQDEYDEDIEGVQRLKEGGAVIQGHIAVRDVNRAMDWKLPDEEAVTLAGLVIHESQTIPEVGQTFAYYGYRFEILEKDRNLILKLWHECPKDFIPNNKYPRKITIEISWICSVMNPVMAWCIKYGFKPFWTLINGFGMNPKLIEQV